MSKLTDVQKAKLIQVVRNQQAKILRKERVLYRQGVNNLKTSFNAYNYITCDRVTVFEQAGNLCLDEILAQRHKALNNMPLNSKGLKVVFESEAVDQDYSCSDCGRSDSAPSVSIYYYQFGFKSLHLVKRNIQSLINHIVRDATFKFEHQYNGKDVKRYLNLIDTIKG